MRPLEGLVVARDRSLAKYRLQPGVIPRVLGQARPFAGLLVVFAATVVLGSAATVLPMVIFQRIIDDGVIAGQRDVIVSWSLIVAGLAVVAAGLSLVERWCSSRIGEGLVQRLRNQLFDHLSQLPLAFFVKSNTGRLVSRVVADVAGAQQAFTTTFSQALSNLVTVSLVLVSMAMLSWPLALAAMVLLPIFMVPAKLVSARVSGLTRERMEHQAQLTQTMTERFTVSGALLVKLFGQPARENARFNAQTAQLAADGVRISMVARFFMAALALVGALATALFYGLGGLAVVDGAMSLGTLTAMVALLARLYGPLMALTNLRVDVMTAMVSFERVFEVLDIAPSIVDAPQAIDVPVPASIAFEDVWFTYPAAEQVSVSSLCSDDHSAEEPELPVIRGISFCAEPGQTVALVGPSGAGKTTLTQLLTRLYDVDSGSVTIGGVDVRQLRLASLRSTIGYVTQDAHLFHDTIRANLDYALPGASEEQLWAALAGAQIADVVRRLPAGLDTVVGERGYRMSGGERQRLAIARLLLISPPVIVLDEATAHLDAASEQLVQRALDVARQGRTAIVVAHRLSTVRQADLILVIEAGKVSERGTHDELLAAGGSYARLYQHQFDLGGSL